MRAESVRLERSDWRGLYTPCAAAVAAVAIIRAKFIAPGKAGVGAGPRSVFPFSLCQESIFLARQAGQPTHILLNVTPTDVDDRHISPTPCVGCSHTGRCSDASIPLLECHLELGNSKGLRDFHLVLRTFAGPVIQFALGGAHDELARGYYDHHWTAPRAFLEFRARRCRFHLFLRESKHGRGRLTLSDNFLRGSSDAARSCERQQTAETCNYPCVARLPHVCRHWVTLGYG